MEIDIIAALFRLTSVRYVDVKNAIDAIQDCSTLQNMMDSLFEKRNLWHVPVSPGSRKEVPSITEKEWKLLISHAADKCKRLGGEFKDPTGTWSF